MAGAVEEDQNKGSKTPNDRSVLGQEDRNGVKAEVIDSIESPRVFQAMKESIPENQEAKVNSEEPWITDPYPASMPGKSELISSFIMKMVKGTVVENDCNSDHCSNTELSETRYEEGVIVDIFTIV